MPAPCGAMVTVDGVRHLCSIAPHFGDLAAAHQHKPHRCEPDGYEWPACSQMCAQNHVHGLYRVKMGATTGPETLKARTPGLGPAWKARKAQRCEACLEPATLDQDGKPTGIGQDGRCTDRKACEARAPALF